jgi:hypothetical protein
MNGKDITKVENIIGSDYKTLVDSVYKRLQELSGNSEISSDVISRMVVGMPQYIDDIVKNGKVTVDQMVYTLLQANKNASTREYGIIYDTMINSL